MAATSSERQIENLHDLVVFGQVKHPKHAQSESKTQDVDKLLVTVNGMVRVETVAEKDDPYVDQNDQLDNVEELPEELPHRWTNKQLHKVFGSKKEQTGHVHPEE